MINQPEANPQEQSSFFTNSRRRAAGVMLGLSMAAGLTGTAQANSAPESSHPMTARTAEVDPLVALRYKILNQIAEGKIKIKVLDLAFSFTTVGNKPSFYFAPTGDKPETTHTINGRGWTYNSRYHWVGKDPAYFTYNHKNWLMFLDPVEIERENTGYTGHVNDSGATLLMNTDHMPADTKLWKSNRLNITGQLEPAYVDKTGTIVTDSISSGTEMLLLNRTEAEANNLIHGAGMTQTHSQYIPGH